MITNEMRREWGEKQPYNGMAFEGDLDFGHGRVVGVAEYCMKLFIDAPVPHFMSTFMFFYMKKVEQENPVTCSAYGKTLTVHPGQGRVIASYLRGDERINSLLLPLNNTKEEIDFLYEVASNVKPFDDVIFSYQSNNHTGVSTKHFENYYYPTTIRLAYEKEKQELLDEKLMDKYPVEFMFNDRASIKVGQTKGYEPTKTKVFCKNPQGLFEYLAFCADGKFANSGNYKIL